MTEEFWIGVFIGANGMLAVGQLVLFVMIVRDIHRDRRRVAS